MLAQLAASFISAIAFGMIFNVPKKTLLPCGIAGVVGWIPYLYLVYLRFDQILATFITSLLVAFLSHFFSKTYKAPIIIFTVPGIIPLVPGGLAYDAMRHVVQQHYFAAIEYAAKAFMISGAIAIGLVFSEVVTKMMVKIHKRISQRM